MRAYKTRRHELRKLMIITQARGRTLGWTQPSLPWWSWLGEEARDAAEGTMRNAHMERPIQSPPLGCGGLCPSAFGYGRKIRMLLAILIFLELSASFLLFL